MDITWKRLTRPEKKLTLVGLSEGDSVGLSSETPFILFDTVKLNGMAATIYLT